MKKYLFLAFLFGTAAAGSLWGGVAAVWLVGAVYSILTGNHSPGDYEPINYGADDVGTNPSTGNLTVNNVDVMTGRISGS